MKFSFKHFLASAIAAASLNATVAVHNTTSSSANIVFGANLTTNNPCFIFIRRAGTWVQNGNATQLSSLAAGGESGIADVLAIFPYAMSVDPVPSFTTSPPGGNNSVTFSSFFAGTALNARGVTFPLRPGTDPIQFPSFFGATRLDVHMVANSTVNLPAGNYTGITRVRCE